MYKSYHGEALLFREIFWLLLRTGVLYATASSLPLSQFFSLLSFDMALFDLIFILFLTAGRAESTRMDFSRGGT